MTLSVIVPVADHVLQNLLCKFQVHIFIRVDQKLLCLLINSALYHAYTCNNLTYSQVKQLQSPFR